MIGLSSILPKPRAVGRSAKQRFLERDSLRREKAHKFFEELVQAQEESLSAHHVAAANQPRTTADTLLENCGHATVKPVKKAVTPPAAPAKRLSAAEELLQLLD